MIIHKTKEQIMETENNIVNNEEETKEEKVYTEEEVLKLIQKESDKRVSQALQTQEKKHKRELSLSNSSLPY